MPLDLYPPPRILADPTEDSHATRRSWVLAVRDTLSGLCEKLANKDQPNGYPGLDANGRIAAADMPAVLSAVRAATGQSGTVVPNAAAAQGGGFLNYTATGNLTIAAPINGQDHQLLRLVVLASGAARTVAFAQNGSTSLIYPVGRLPMSYTVPNGMVLVADLVYSSLAGAWLVVAADVEGTGDAGQFTCTNAGVSQSIGANANVVLAYGTDVSTTALVTKATSGAGHQFTLNRAGVWAISHSALWTNGSAGNKRCLLNVSGTTGLPTWMAAGSGTTTATSSTAGNGAASGSVTARFAAGTVLYVAGYSVAADSIVAGQASLVLTYVGP